MSPAFRTIVDAAGLDELLGELSDEPIYALDTEFHRERTYYPKIALLQIAWPGGLALVDPLAVDLRPFGKVLEGQGLAVLHAAQQDLDVLTRATGTIPARLFDTQIAAGFVGHSTPSLLNLLSSELDIKVRKGERLTDWLRRPLTEAQQAYAISDVEHLLELYDVLVVKLTERGRLQWALDECEDLRRRPVGPGDPDAAWLKLKDARHLRGKARSVALALAAWRERRAMASDTPVRFILSDMAIIGMAQRPPNTAEDLRSVRGLDDRHARGSLGAELLEAVARGIDIEPAKVREPRTDEIDRHLRPAVTLVSAWLSQHARDIEIDPALLATRTDIVDLLANQPDARLLTGWRAEMVGDNIRRLVGGEAALAFDGRGNLRLLAIP